MEEKSLDDIVSRISNLPSMPTVVQEMFRVMGIPDCTSRDVARALEKDQALTAKILRVANSPFYGLSRKVDTVDRACTILGLNTVKNLVLSVSVIDVFKSKKRAGAFDVREMWKHNLGCAVAAKAVFETKYKNGDDAFVGGLLHDIGKMILDIYMPKEYIRVHELYSRGMPLIEAEMQVIGKTHALAGRILARKWKFPEHIEEMIALHHRPASAKIAPEQVFSVHIGNEIAKSLSLGSSNERFVMPIDERAWNAFFDRPGILASTLEIICDEYEQIGDAFGLDGNTEEKDK